MIHFLFPDSRPCSYSIRVLGFSINYFIICWA